VADDKDRPRRRDFEQNRETILAAAQAIFSEEGMGASVESIAKRAGVGAATVYRHFPQRGLLVDAVFELRAAEFVEAIEAAQATDDPREAFRRTMHAIVDLQTRDRSFREILAGRDELPLDRPVFLEFGMTLLHALDDARRAGVVREDVENTDLMLLMLASEGIARQTARKDPAALRRIVDIVLDGVCAERTELGGEAVTLEQLVAIVRDDDQPAA
jgi:AcrR family transcriptional regulator